MQWVKVAGVLIVPRPSLDCRQLWDRCGARLAGTDVERFCGDVDRAIREVLLDYGCPVRRVAVSLGWGSVYAVDERDVGEGGVKCVDVVYEVVKSRFDVAIVPFVGQVPVLLS